MVDLDQNVADLAQRASNQDKILKTLINGNAADLSGLLTTDKGSLLAAVNELKAAVDVAAQSGGAVINDAATSTGSTWSSTKSQQVITDAVENLRTALLGPNTAAALDSLRELAAALGDDPDFAGTVMTQLGNRVRFDAPQVLTSEQKAQALANIGGVSAAAVGNTDTDYVAIFEAGLV